MWNIFTKKKLENQEDFIEKHKQIEDNLSINKKYSILQDIVEIEVA